MLSADYVFGFAPAPGVQRVLDPGDLARIARLHGIDVASLHAVCFERTTTILSEAQVLAALRAALSAEFRIELIDYSRQNVPEGDLEFSQADLPRPRDVNGAVTWRGRVRYGGRHSSPVWAMARVLKEQTWVEAASTIAAHAPIDGNLLALKTGWRFPLPNTAVRSPDLVAGNAAVRAIPAGEPITTAMFKAIREVHPGDPVDVEVGSGSVRLRFGGTAATGGRTNDTVLVSVDGGRKVKARVAGKGRVYVDAQSVSGVRGADDRAAFRQIEETGTSAGSAARPVSR
jgi:flagella basal body P-ring formation protein FlgA